MIPDAARHVLEHSGFATGFFTGLVALAVGVVVIVAWQQSRRTSLPPVAGLVLVGGATVALDIRDQLPDQLVLALVLLTLAGAGAEAIRRWPTMAVLAGSVLALPGGWLVAEATGVQSLPSRLLIVAVLTLSTTLVALADRAHRRLGLGPLLVLVTVAGVYATIPDTESAVVMLGAAIPAALLGWPWPLASLGWLGSPATVGLLSWVIVTGGMARVGSLVGAAACLGVLLVVPTVRPRLRPRRFGPNGRTNHHTGDGLAAWRDALPIILAHLLLVTIAARVAGLRTSGWEAGAIAAAALGIVIAATLRWPALHRLAGPVPTATRD